MNLHVVFHSLRFDWRSSNGVISFCYDSVALEWGSSVTNWLS